MKLLLSDLTGMQPLARVVIRSVDPGLYQLLVCDGGEERLVWADRHRPLCSRNLVQLREQLSALAIDELVLRHESAYDEMVGQPLREHSNRLEVPVGRDSYPAIETERTVR